MYLCVRIALFYNLFDFYSSIRRTYYHVNDGILGLLYFRSKNMVTFLFIIFYSDNLLAV